MIKASKKTGKTLHKRDIEFLFEMGSLRFVQRTWKRFLNPDVENLSEHHFRVTWISLLLAKYEGITNTERIMKMALVHDIAESRTGDVDYLSRQYTVRNEKLGIEDMLKNTELEEEFLSLWNEYEDRKTIEAKIVKDADNLAVDFELREQESKGNTWGDALHETRTYVAKNKLYTETARKLWKMIQTSDPHGWHRNGRNRKNDGDWKE